MDPYAQFRGEILSLIDEAVASLYGKIKSKPALEKPPEDFGDFSFPCFQLAPVARKSPSDIAAELAGFVKSKKSEWIEKVEEKNGYVNFFVNKTKLAELALKGAFEKEDKREEKVILEHTSANPNGPLHVGRARNPIIGDTLARIFRWRGYDVETQFYVDDMGKQVAILMWGLKNIDMKVEEKKADHRLVAFYQKAYEMMEEDEEVRKEIGQIIKKCEEGDRETLEEMKRAYEKALDGIVESLKRLNITIDSFVEESRFVLDGSVQYVIEELKRTEFADYENGALYLDMENFGIHGRNKKFFLTRNDGTSLYATRDIAYHLWKGKRADMMINVLGEDHKLEARFVEVALKILGSKTPVTVFYSFVSLPEGKMSTRRGRVVYLDDLIEEAVERAYEEVRKRRNLDEERARFIAEKVGTGAIRYNIVKVNPEKAITFRWEEALNFEGESAPFIQYAHARCCSIMKKAGVEDADFTKVDFSEYSHPQEINLIKAIASFPGVVRRCEEEFNPAFLAEYAHKLASSFNAFYRDCQVVGSEKERERLALVRATQQTLKNALTLLGIEALEEM
ncbi:MAG: arginine--tRNA ligase [Thermoplasmata archaeon]|nr:MAG: arginine--tRNA ligase [Thermoplasmata archaeon]RLF62815.1 MAG: arginine--tRNA ligase [Thermoplasmata archaeon]